MKKSLNTTLSRQDLQNIGQVIDGKLGAQRRDIYDRFDQFGNKLLATEKRLEIKMENLLSDHHDSIIETVSAVVIKDRIEPLEIRVTRLEARKV